jgi:hypothetical protein
MTQNVKKQRRADIERSTDSLLITARSMKRIPLIVFLAASLGVWFLGEKIIVSLIVEMSVLQGYTFVFLLWFIGWTAMGFYLFLKLAWALAGRETVIVSPDILKIEKKYIGMRRSKEYVLKEVENIQLEPNEALRHRRGIVHSAFFKGFIKFNYGTKTIAFLNSVEEDEAVYILEQIKQHIRKNSTH